MILHHNSGYRVHCAFESGIYSVWITTRGDKNKLTIRSRKQSKIQKNIPHYIDFVNYLANSSKNSWRPQFDVNKGKYFKFKSQADNQCIVIKIRIFKPLSLRKWNRIKLNCPIGTPEEFKQRNDHNLIEIRQTASKVRREFFEEYLLQDTSIEISEMVDLLETSENLESDLTDIISNSKITV